MFIYYHDQILFSFFVNPHSLQHTVLMWQILIGIPNAYWSTAGNSFHRSLTPVEQQITVKTPAASFVWTFLSSGRDLWGAVCSWGGAWPAVCPHSLGIHRHPWITSRRRHSEQVRRQICVSCVQIDAADKIRHVAPVCCRRNCIISAYYQQRETHNPAVPNVSENQTSVRYKSLHAISVTERGKKRKKFTCLSYISLSRVWEALERPEGTRLHLDSTKGL